MWNQREIPVKGLGLEIVLFSGGGLLYDPDGKYPGGCGWDSWGLTPGLLPSVLLGVALNPSRLWSACGSPWRARFHDPEFMTRAETKSRTLNRLCHPGAPTDIFKSRSSFAIKGHQKMVPPLDRGVGLKESVLFQGGDGHSVDHRHV